MVQSPIENDYITFSFDDVNGEVNTELRQKVLLQVFVRELLIDMQKNIILGFQCYLGQRKRYLLIVILI